MIKNKDRMSKFEFLLGGWKLEYNIPKSELSEAATGSGSGTFIRALDNHYVFFDYTSFANEQETQAHGIFTWDNKSEIYRYWWFESSGYFMKATCHFVDDDTLCMNWHDSILIQSFIKINPNKIILKMQQQRGDNQSKLILEVIFTRQQSDNPKT